MRKIIGILCGLICIGNIFADAEISLLLPSKELDISTPFDVQVMIIHDRNDILGNIYIEGLDNFILVGESRSDSQVFDVSGAMNIVKLNLELVGKTPGNYPLGPVTLEVNDDQIQTQILDVNIGESSIQNSENISNYTPIQSIYFQNTAIKISTLKALTILCTIIGAIIFLVMFWVYRRNLQMRKFGYIQVLYSLDAQANSKKAPKRFYTDVYNLFKSYLEHEKKTGFGGKNIKDMKQKLSKKEFNILDLVYNIEYNRSKDTPKYRKKILKELHKYFDKNIV